METRFYESTGSRCGRCGSDLGTQTIWTLVYSDDAPDLVRRVRQGTLNWVRCSHPNCQFEGGWLWPNTFLFVDIQEQRVVCVTMATTAAQQFDLLREALDSDSIRQRNLDPDVLLKRTQFVNDYRSIEESLSVAIETVELENASILQYLKREDLSGRARINALIEALIETGAISLEEEETTEQFLSELEEYRSTLTGEEDWRVPVGLEQIIEQLRGRAKGESATLPLTQPGLACWPMCCAPRVPLLST